MNSGKAQTIANGGGTQKPQAGRQRGAIKGGYDQQRSEHFQPGQITVDRKRCQPGGVAARDKEKQYARRRRCHQPRGSPAGKRETQACDWQQDVKQRNAKVPKGRVVGNPSLIGLRKSCPSLDRNRLHAEADVLQRFSPSGGRAEVQPLPGRAREARRRHQSLPTAIEER